MLRRTVSPSTLGKFEVHEHDIGIDVDSLIDRFHPVSGFRDDLNARLLTQNSAEAFQDNRVAVGD